MFNKRKTRLTATLRNGNNQDAAKSHQQVHALFTQKSKPLFILCVVTAIISLTTLSFSAWAASNGTVLLEVPGIDIEYGGYSTCEMYAESAPAFCAEPAKSTPLQSIYAKSTITPLPGSSGYTHPVRSIASALWFGWGGPGFDPSLWPSTWYDGTPMNAHRYWALEHIILADYYTCNGGSALAGCNEEFRAWALGNVLSYVSESNPYDQNAAQSKIGERAGEVPQKFVDSCYQLKTGSSQTIVSFEQGGWIDLDKDSSIPNISLNNGCYSLENARYGIYANASDAKNDTNRIQVLSTDTNGYTKSSYLNRGTYFIKEIAPSNGFELDESIYSVEVSKGATSRVQQTKVFDTPAHDSGTIELAKKDLETSGSIPGGNASLEHAEFTIWYYQGYYNNVKEAQLSGAPTKTWVYKTNAEGKLQLNNKEQLVSGEAFCAEDGTVILPLGTYLIQETKAPEGYLVSDEILIRTVRQHEGFSALGSFSSTHKTTEISNQIIRGGVSLVKLDKESLEGKPLGAGTLNATFEIINESNNPVLVAGVAYNSGEVVYSGTATPDKQGTFVFTTDTDNDGKDTTLPYGTYRIKETNPGNGYLLCEEEIVFNIKEDTTVVAITNNQTLKNQIKRGDLELTKVGETDMKRLVGVPFKITSETTGESHVFITDENGYASTASSWNKHSSRTNENDHLVQDNQSSKLSTSGKVTETNVLNDNMNLSFQDSSTDTILKDSAAQLGNQSERAASSNSDSTSYHNNSGSENKSDDDNQAKQDANNKQSESSSKQPTNTPSSQNKPQPYEAGIWFGKTPAGSMTSVDDSLGALPFDTYTIEELPCDANKYYSLVKLEGIVIKRESYTVNLGTVQDKENKPLIQTTASDARDSDHNLFASTEEHIVDTVFYENLEPKKEYELRATIYDHTTQTLLSDEPTIIRFTPENQSGSIEITIPIETIALAGHTLTVFEELYDNNALLCEHKDPEDSMQSVTVLEPRITTHATSVESDEKIIYADNITSISDTVSFWNLAPNKEYTLSGQLINKETNGIIAKKIKQFTPSSANGQEVVTFDFDGLSLFKEEDNPERDSLSLVAFETLAYNENEIARHTDLNNESQSIELVKPAIETFAFETETNSKTLSSLENAQLSDRITYSGLVPEKTYNVIGAAIDVTHAENESFAESLGKFKAGTALSQEELTELQALLQENSTSIAFREFTPETNKGEITVPFTLNSEKESGKTFVVYEYVLKNNRIIAAHQDKDDKNQQFSTEIITPEKPTPTPLSKTGDSNLFPLITFLLFISILGAGFIAYKQFPTLSLGFLGHHCTTKKEITSRMGKW